MSAHSLQIAVAYSLPLAIAAAASWHIAAQSMFRAMQRAIVFTSLSFRHEAAQWLHATAQVLQASMQAANLSSGISISFECAGSPAGVVLRVRRADVEHGGVS